ncbi:pantoate--beta-alanine ligase [Pseudobacteroides cellulosolvens]|uniref:Pantothenate synthetase n=1 Tax=Pseudobacteroides cellulosolvens ATCC 35603 = DSM 2933 TaxID=398512 RepID=A0A0L6JIA1_9FIRM|nr:pantoate--beta-alanine ligase [Pseudobacteroides cellulosolvens]KNY25450.1 Pantothenate synthetase [Pseudobacteroides cellulosolvens ATCC 35603 = DSM 2933]
MRVIEKISDLKAIIRSQKSSGKTIGFVPTMGYLHQGHMSLVKASKDENDFTIMSIFVNPTQFGPNEDFDKYPRDMARDTKMAEAAGVDVIFAPLKDEMYPARYKTYVDVEDITNVLCGKSRPSHFKGVTTVVTKLFNIVEPDKAYFGQKDAQQVIVLKKMVRDLNMNLEIVTCPIVRESDGLAMSSRNTYLTPEQRIGALVLSKSLFEAEQLIKDGERDAAKLIGHISERISEVSFAEIDYIEITDIINLEKVDTINGKVLIALAVRFGKTRLIDNVIVEV